MINMIDVRIQLRNPNVIKQIWKQCSCARFAPAIVIADPEFPLRQIIHVMSVTYSQIADDLARVNF